MRILASAALHIRAGGAGLTSPPSGPLSTRCGPSPGPFQPLKITQVQALLVRSIALSGAG